MTNIDFIPIGSILEIDFNLIFHPDTWIKHRRSILLKVTPTSIKVWDTINEHTVVLQRKGTLNVKVIV